MANRRIVVIIDAQNDFIHPDFALGSEAAEEALKHIIEQIHTLTNEDEVYLTKDIHLREEYVSSLEGDKIPPHCLVTTEGSRIDSSIVKALEEKQLWYTVTAVRKNTFGTFKLAMLINEEDDLTIEIMGFCTDICVISNASILRTAFPNSRIIIRENCCAGTSPEAHEAALLIARQNLIEVI